MSSLSDALAPGAAGTMALDEFARWTIEALAPHGFEPGNALALIGVCRDELMFAIESAVSAQWGAAFDISSLAGMVFLGSSGMAAAAHHAPGLDGRRRYVIVVMPHIGVAEDGSVGLVLRDGQHHESTACGALVGLQQELATGLRRDELDHDDLEMSLLRRDVVADLGPGETPDLVALTDLVRRLASDEMARLADGLVRDADADVAMFSGVVVHHHDEDRVYVADAWVTLRDDAVRRALHR